MLKKRKKFHNASAKNKSREREEYCAAARTKLTELVVFGVKDLPPQLQAIVMKAVRIFTDPEKGKAQLKLKKVEINLKANAKKEAKAKEEGFKSANHKRKLKREAKREALGMDEKKPAALQGWQERPISGRTWEERYKQANRLRKLMVRYNPKIHCLSVSDEMSYDSSSSQDEQADMDSDTDLC